MAYLARSPLPYPGPDRGCGADQSPLGNARAHDHPVPPGRERERELVGDVSEKRLGHYVGRIVRR